MGVSFGRVKAVENPGAPAAKLRLERGDRVQLNPILTRKLFAEYSPAHTLYFVNQGFLPKVFWFGTAKELRMAVASGAVPVKALGRWPVPAAVSQTHPGWELDMEDPFNHVLVGAKLPEIRDAWVRAGRTETAATMTVEFWMGHMRSQGACLANRTHGGHLPDGVFCIAPARHQTEHVAVCPACEIVAFSVKVLAEATGEWGK